MDTHYFVKGHGLPVIFQHGLGADSSQITGLIDPAIDCMVLSCDSGGHGQSPLPSDGKVSFNRYADEIISVMEASGISKAVIGGLSMGAGIAVNIADRFPEKVLALILHRPAWVLSVEPPNLNILLKTADAISEGKGMETFRNDPEFRRIFAGLPDAASSVLQLFKKRNSGQIPEILRMMVRDAPVTSPPRISVPVLIIANENDPLHPISVAQDWHRMIPGSKLKIVTSRYLDNEKHHRQVNEALINFLNPLKSEFE